MKKLLAFILVIATLLFAVSCEDENRKYNEEDIKDAAETLLPKTKRLNDIFWGSGIRYVEDDNYKEGKYYPADPIHLSELGYESVDGILRATKKVFSEGIYNVIYSTIFTRSSMDMDFVRYYQSEDRIMVNPDFKIELYDKVEYLTDTIKVLGSKGERVEISVDVKITQNETGETQIREKNFFLVEEEGEWKIDSFTYAKFMSNK